MVVQQLLASALPRQREAARLQPGIGNPHRSEKLATFWSGGLAGSREVKDHAASVLDLVADRLQFVLHAER
jgi:hypothetical protein